MPLPEPEQNENKQDFMERCIENTIIKREFNSQEQVVAVCERIWEEN